MVAFLIAALAGAALLAPLPASAHCPLCTAGAGILAVAAVALGVNPMAVGVFIGAFAVALGLWAARAARRFRFPMKAAAFAVASFLLTVWPLAPLFDSYTSWYVDLGGGYGTLLNRTYVINRFVLGAVIGAALLALAPKASRAVSAARRGVQFPFQGMAIGFALLIAASLVIQFAV